MAHRATAVFSGLTGSCFSSLPLVCQIEREQQNNGSCFSSLPAGSPSPKKYKRLQKAKLGRNQGYYVGGLIDTQPFPYHMRAYPKYLYLRPPILPIFWRIEGRGHISPRPGTLGLVGLAGYSPPAGQLPFGRGWPRDPRQGLALNASLDHPRGGMHPQGKPLGVRIYV